VLGLKRVEQCDRFLGERLFPVKLPHSEASTVLEMPKLLSLVLKAVESGLPWLRRTNFLRTFEQGEVLRWLLLPVRLHQVADLTLEAQLAIVW
jgi:hypothetical protein